MSKKTSVFNTINIRILLVLLVLFIIIAVIIGAANNNNIRDLYEASYTERLLLTNALMGSIIRSDDIEYFVNLIKNQGDDFKRRQVDFYYTREELFRLQREGGSEEEQQTLLDELAVFIAETQPLKNDVYWKTLAALKELKEISRSTYVYVMADTGLVTRDGDTLYTYIFDAEDEGEYSSPDMDGLGTSDIGNEAFDNVFATKKQTEQAEHYVGDFGELYFVCVPILNDNGDVIAVLGTDLSLDDMNAAIASTSSLFNSIIIVIFIVSVIVIFALLSRSIGRPLSSLTETALKFAEGNLHTSIAVSALKQRTEIGTLAHAIKSTLDATTLYLNSIPESLFIMNRDRETYFRNEQFVKRFGDMQAEAFMLALFPESTYQEIESKLRLESNTTTAWIDGSCFAVMLKEIVLSGMAENSVLVIANDITDLMNEKENAQAAAAAKSAFLSRMSHEMRTPMNAIIGMSKLAGDSDSIASIKHCVSVISASSEQLLGIINDVLDMSKIDAGKLELENTPLNLETTLMKVCSIFIDAMEKKKLRFNVVLSRGVQQHYIADELRLSQVLTNLLSNAVKFTPEGGAVTLTVESVGEQESASLLRFAVSDTGIGMSDEQIARLFNAFEQADGSITRRYGGTGLGLVISQSIVMKMGGRIEVQAKPGAGTTFSFTVAFTRASHQDTASLHGVCPEDIRLLIIDGDDDARKHLLGIAEDIGVHADSAGDANEACAHLDAAIHANMYDVIFLTYELGDTNGIDLVCKYGGIIDSGSLVVTTTHLEWLQIEQYAREGGITRHITKPFFPSSVLNAINDVMDSKAKVSAPAPDIAKRTPDFSGVRLLLAEDIEINREIFIALMEGTNVTTDTAENGLEAVSKFRVNPELYDLIVMDIQMPEMDGYEATRAIRAMDAPNAKTIPIMAVSANAFAEDIERCLESGMNDHIAKPIDADELIGKITKYLGMDKS